MFVEPSTSLFPGYFSQMFQFSLRTCIKQIFVFPKTKIKAIITDIKIKGVGG